jgi:hypothetical protein
MIRVRRQIREIRRTNHIPFALIPLTWVTQTPGAAIGTTV